MALNPTGIVRPEETIRSALGTLGVDMTYEDDVFTDIGHDSWTSGVEVLSPLGGVIQASWDRLANGEMLGSAFGEPAIRVHYREWDTNKELLKEQYLADVATPEMAAVVMASVHGQHMAQADQVAGDNLSASPPQPDRNKVTSALATILAEVTKIAYSPDKESDELDNAREAGSMLIEMAGFDLDDSDGMGQPMGTTVLGLLLSACHLVPQMRDRLLGRAEDVQIVASEA